MQAKIIKSSMRQFECAFEDKKVQAIAHGNLLKHGDLVVGDEVILSFDSQHNEYAITELLPRKNFIFRNLAREKKKKIIASNIDYIFLIVSCSYPEYKRGLLHRYLLRARLWGIPLIVLFNKFDEYKEEHFEINQEIEHVEWLGCKTNTLSIFDKNKCDDLKKILENKTAIFLGQSGVGKSSLINVLSDNEFELKTKALAKVNKGSHTTTWAEIIDCKNFYIVDTPGIRSFSLEDITIHELDEAFTEVSELALKCTFSNCNHATNAKGCALNSVTDKHFVSLFESYQRFKEEI